MKLLLIAIFIVALAVLMARLIEYFDDRSFRRNQLGIMKRYFDEYEDTIDI